MSGCCNEPACRRTKPIRVMQSPLTGIWYAVTDYIDLGEDRFTAKVKHKLPANNQRDLNEMQAAVAKSRKGRRKK